MTRGEGGWEEELDGINSGNEENFCWKLTVSSTLSIPSSRVAFLKNRFMEVGVTGVTGVTGVDGAEGTSSLRVIMAGVGPSTNSPSSRGIEGRGGGIVRDFLGRGDWSSAGVLPPANTSITRISHIIRIQCSFFYRHR